MSDCIIIDRMEVMAHVGVPDEERAMPQRLEISLVLERDLREAARKELLDRTVDYAAIHQSILKVVQSRPRPLIETLAEDVAQAVLKEFEVEAVEVKVYKFILPKTRYVAVRIRRMSAV